MMTIDTETTIPRMELDAMLIGWVQMEALLMTTE